MANFAGRIFNRKQALEREIKDGYVTISIGAAGAPTLTAGPLGASIVRNSAGNYSLTIDDKYASLKSFRATLLSATAEDIRFQLHSETVSTTQVVSFLCLTGATETDPSNGSVILIKMDLKNAQGF